MDSHDNEFICDGNMTSGLIGMHGIAFIHSGDVVLVCPLSEEQRVKGLINQQKREP